MLADIITKLSPITGSKNHGILFFNSTLVFWSDFEVRAVSSYRALNKRTKGGYH